MFEEPVTVELEKCNEKQLIFTYENERIETDFFNLVFTSPKARIQACELLNDADTIKIQKERNIQDLKVYVFTEGKLFQKELIDLELAEVMIDYSDYIYYEEIKKEEKIQVISNPNETIDYQKSWIILISLVTVCIFLLLILIKL